MAITKTQKDKQLFKILVGTAWIDGVIEPEERAYLRQVAQELQLTQDSEIRILLSELKTVQPTECYLWVEEYLVQYSKAEDYFELLERVGGIVYGNGDVDIRETKFLEKIQSFDPSNRTYKIIPEWILRKIRRFYQKLVKEIIYS